MVRRIDDGGPLMFWSPPQEDAPGYAVLTAICGNPECPCTAMRLTVCAVAMADGHVETRESILVGEVQSDGTGLKLDTTSDALPGETVAWVTEQLGQESSRSWLQERWRRGRGQIGDARYVSGIVPEDLDGMAPFHEVFPYDFDQVVVHDGRYFLTEDHYCLEPDCACDEVIVTFVDAAEEARRVGNVRVSLARFGAPKLEGPRSLQQLWRKFVDRYGADRIRARFDRMRQVARARRKASASVVRSVPKVGRNESCPCGSGKKFKRCCGT